MNVLSFIDLFWIISLVCRSKLLQIRMILWITSYKLKLKLHHSIAKAGGNHKITTKKTTTSLQFLQNTTTGLYFTFYILLFWLFYVL